GDVHRRLRASGRFRPRAGLRALDQGHRPEQDAHAPAPRVPARRGARKAQGQGRGEGVRRGRAAAVGRRRPGRRRAAALLREASAADHGRPARPLLRARVGHRDRGPPSHHRQRHQLAALPRPQGAPELHGEVEVDVTPEQTTVVEQYLDATIAAPEAKQLLEWLEADAAFRGEFAEALRMNGLLHAGVGPDAACERLADVVAVAIPSGGRNLDSRVMDQIQKQGLRPARRRSWVRWGGAAAAACALLVGGWLLFRGAPPLQVVAAGSDVAVDRDGASLTIAPPAALRGGDAVRVPAGGWAWLRYADGTTLQVGSDTALSIEGDPAVAKHVRVTRGVVFADVMPQPRPMVLASPHAETKVLGTSFSLAVGKESTRLLVRQGKVAFTKPEE